jgi:hypothetical protein
MGAAVRTADGQIVTGVDVHHFAGRPCSELVALGAARPAPPRQEDSRHAPAP